MSINELFSATFNSLQQAAAAGGRKDERAHAAEWPAAVDEWTRKQVRTYFKRQLQLDEYVGALRRAKVDGARLVALHHADALYTTLGVTKIGHKKKLMVALRGLLQAQAVDAPPSWPAVVASATTTAGGADCDHQRPCGAGAGGNAGLRVRRATMATAADDQQHHHHNRGKNEDDEAVVAAAAKNERAKATATTVVPLLDWAKLQRSRSSPVDDVVSVVSSSESADSPRAKHSPRPATTRSAGRSPRSHNLPTHPIVRTGSRTHIHIRDLDLPTFGSAVVPAVSTTSHDTASTHPAWSMPVSPTGSLVFGAITCSSPSSSPPPPASASTHRQLHHHDHHHDHQSAAPTCSTLAYARAFGGVAVKCVYGDDVSMLRFHFDGGCTESGDDTATKVTVIARQVLHVHSLDTGLSGFALPATAARPDSDSDSESDSDSDSESDSDSDDDEQREEADKLHFVELRDTIRATYGRNLRVKYIDRDGDTINIDSDASLNYAFNDWRGQIGLADRHRHQPKTTTSWRLHLHDIDDHHDHHGSSRSPSSSLSATSSSSSLFLASSAVHDTVVETHSRRNLYK